MDILAQADAFFDGNRERWELFEALRQSLLRAWPQTSLRVMKTCIAFDDPKPYCYVSLPRRSMLSGRNQSSLLVSVSLDAPQENPRFFAVAAVSKRRYTAHIILQNCGEIDDEFLGWVARSHCR